MAITDEIDPKLLLIRRSLHLPTHPGEIALPGGKRDPGDADLCATALREAWEEVTLEPTDFRYAGTLLQRTSMTGLAVAPIIGTIAPGLALHGYAGEVAEILYAPLAFFADPAHLRADRVRRSGVERIAPRYQYRHYTIWGLTAGFIVQVVNLLYGAGLDYEARAQSILRGAP